jgi:DNA polymerase-1
VFVVLDHRERGVVAVRFTDGGVVEGEDEVDDLAAYVAQLEAGRPRWVWDDTKRWYPQLLRAGVRVERCVDLRLCHAILRLSVHAADSALARNAPSAWDEPFHPLVDRADDALFELEPAEAPVALDVVGEWMRQREATEGSPERGRLGLLLAAESAGALIAEELAEAGLPFDIRVHDELLVGLLGERVVTGRPAKLEAVLDELREALEDPNVNPDSPSELLKSLARTGIRVSSTSQWELKRIEHPAIDPLLRYKKLSRLLTANGWRWADDWVRDGRFRPEYVPGGVVTGRWAANGGGALQLPKQIRGAVVADPGWKLVVADAAQLEPRVLAAMSGDRAMAEAGEGDMYAGIVATGAVETRAQAKVAMLGAMYGATSGESGRLLPRLARQFPRAMRMVDDAARAGERGEVVSTLLGRSSPPPSAEWRAVQRRANTDAASDSRAQSWARSQGRFTRNFIVQGTAAEWALSWMGILRARLWDMPGDGLLAKPHLVFFLHDEVIVHTPEHEAEAVVAHVRAAAVEAGRLLFGTLPVAFPVTTAVVDSYAQAK